MEKKPKKVKVYGLDSTKNVRARLIEILMERVMYHKDKFIAPILHEEMKAMQIKKNGKVEHSDQSHDDQVFSYLMALYVWYDGQNLMENFNIRKSTIRTDTDEELEEASYEEALEAKTRIDFRSSEFEDNEEIAQELEWIELDKLVTSADLEEEQYLQNIERKNIIIANNKQSSDSMEVDIGVIVTNTGSNQVPGFTNLPNSIFNIDDDFEEMDNSSSITDRSPLSGNLASFYDMV